MTGQHAFGTDSDSVLGEVALLGIAQRSIQVKYPANLGNQRRSNVLKLSMKTAGDWLKVKRLEKNLTRSHGQLKWVLQHPWFVHGNATLNSLTIIS